LAPSARVLIAQYPGRQDRYRDPFAESIPYIAGAVATDLTSALDSGTAITVFGHSMGSLVGFELAKQLEVDGCNVRQFIASGRNAPHIRGDGLSPELPNDSLLGRLLDMGGTDPLLLDHRELMEIALRVLRADLWTIAQYRPDPGDVLTCPIVAVRGTSDSSVNGEGAAEWRRYTRSGTRMMTLPGGHFYLADEEQQQTLAEIILGGWPDTIRTA
jgi:thioesterase